MGSVSDNMGGRGAMTTASISLQDLRRRLYVKAKAGFGWKRWSTAWLYDTLGLFADYRGQIAECGT